MYLAKPKPRGCDAGKCGSSASCRLASRHVGKRTRVGVYLPDPVALALGEIALVQQTRVLTLTRYTRREWTSGSEIGAYNAAESGESLAECIALDIHRVRQRLAVQIWRDYQDHLTARIRFADPDEDDKRRHEEEARVDAEEQELAARRLFNEAYLQRMGRPQAFGLC